MVLPVTSEGTLKLTKPLVVRLLFRPIRISRVLLPPLLLERKPSRLVSELTVLERMVGVGVGVGVGGLGVSVGLGVEEGFAVGEGKMDSVGVAVGTETVGDGAGVGETEEVLFWVDK